ncbi:TPA: hypothetical protein HA278_03250 [Candidatus Woesearchaeota archaeon]|nr:hypothetical protein [archaeon]HIJ11050.1 hypothetical protein [Candidatus Woesearchaeota archaeon]|tara:strand:+ start:574 stop:801 length:228 start_codon:yes stop_codon:yes gene_type:complete
MEDYYQEGDESNKTQEEEQPEDGFMRGFMEDENVATCSECDAALDDEHSVKKELDGEMHGFCSDACLKEYEESMG